MTFFVDFKLQIITKNGREQINDKGKHVSKLLLKKTNAKCHHKEKKKKTKA